MRNLPFIITAVIVMAIMLAAALYSRTAAVGPSRSVRFGNSLVINVDSKQPVAVLVESLQPDGSRSPVAWAYLGPNLGASQVGGVTLPQNTTLIVTCCTGMHVVQAQNGLETVIATGDQIVGGAGAPGTALAAMPGASPRSPWVTTINSTPGLLWIVRPTSVGGQVTTAPVPVGTPPPIPSPVTSPPPPAPLPESESTPEAGDS